MQDSNNAADCHILYEQNNSSDPAFCYPWRTAKHGELKSIAHNYTSFVKFWPIVLATTSKFLRFSPLATELFEIFWR